MTTAKSRVGQIGEELAVKHLVKHGYRVLGRNIRRPWGELDIVSRKGGILVFVEVKTLVYPEQSRGVKHLDYLQPEDELTFHKIRKFQKAILMYFKENRIDLNQEWRGDLIAIDLNPDLSLADLRHIENVLFEF